MYTINRQVAVLKPKEAYVRWVNSVIDPEDPCNISDLRNDCTAFLIPHFDDDSESLKYIEKIYKKIFEIELNGWSTDKGTWPKKFDLSLFQKWFYVEFHSEVFDPIGDPIVKD